MSDIAQMMRAANPVPDPVAALPDAEFDALLALTETRSGTMAIDQLDRLDENHKQTYRRNRWLVAAAAFAAVLVIGIAWGVLATLGGDEPEVVDPPPELELGPEDRPTTPVTAVLGADPGGQAYFARSADDFDSAVMGVEPGAVTAEWYRAEGFYVVYFAGVDTTTTPGLCPSASVFEGGGQDFMANAAAGGADCSAIVINALPDPEVRTLECKGSLAFRTAIPEGTDGALIAALERPAETSSGGTGIMGISSEAGTEAGAIPEVDLSIFDC